jgi:hypothetical protein
LVTQVTGSGREGVVSSPLIRFEAIQRRSFREDLDTVVILEESILQQVSPPAPATPSSESQNVGVFDFISQQEAMDQQQLDAILQRLATLERQNTEKDQLIRSLQAANEAMQQNRQQIPDGTIALFSKFNTIVSQRKVIDKSNVNGFLTEVEKCITLCNANADPQITMEILAMAKSRLKDNVAWNDKTFNTVEDFKKVVKRELLRPQTLTAVKLQLEKLKMSENESISFYASRARKLHYEYLLAVEADFEEAGKIFDQRAKKDTEELVIIAFINRLVKDVRERMGSPKTYGSLEEAIKKAQEEHHGVESFPVANGNSNFNTRSYVKKFSKPVEKKSNQSSQQDEMQQGRTEKKVFNRQENRQQEWNQRAEDVRDGPVCYGCDEKGHYKRECPGKKTVHFNKSKSTYMMSTSEPRQVSQLIMNCMSDCWTGERKLMIDSGANISTIKASALKNDIEVKKLKKEVLIEGIVDEEAAEDDEDD